MSLLSYPTAFAHFVLAATSAWGLVQASKYNYASLGFGLYFVNGVLGILAYGLPSSGLMLYRFYSQVLLWALSLGLPLFVSQLYVNIGLSETLALVHFILPLAYIFSGRHLKRLDIFWLETLQLVYLAFLLYLSVTNGYFYGISTVLSFAIAFYAIGTTGTIKNTPSRDLFNYALSFSVYFLIQTLNGN